MVFYIKSYIWHTGRLSHLLAAVFYWNWQPNFLSLTWHSPPLLLLLLLSLLPQPASHKILKWQEVVERDRGKVIGESKTEKREKGSNYSLSSHKNNQSSHSFIFLSYFPAQRRIRWEIFGNFNVPAVIIILISRLSTGFSTSLVFILEWSSRFRTWNSSEINECQGGNLKEAELMRKYRQKRKRRWVYLVERERSWISMHFLARNP